ncbi:hypothetical protein D3C72_1818260 [compost metagenome]
MRVAGASHGERVLVVLQAVVGFVFDRGMGLLLLHAGFEAAALDHEAIDHAMEHRAVVEPFLDVGQEVLDGLRGLGCVQGNDHVALVGLELDAGIGAHGFGAFRGGGGRRGRGGGADERWGECSQRERARRQAQQVKRGVTGHHLPCLSFSIVSTSRTFSFMPGTPSPAAFL